MTDKHLAEVMWERGMNLAGIERYQRSLYAEDGTIDEASGSATGQRMIRKMLKTAAAAVEDLAVEVLSTTRTSRNNRASVLLVPSETAALIVLRALIDQTYGAEDRELGTVYQTFCSHIGESVEIELNIRNWIQGSKEASAEYAKSVGRSAPAESPAERLIREKNWDRKTAYRWSKSFSEMQQFKWTAEEQTFCGTALTKSIIDALPRDFEYHNTYDRGRTLGYVRMTPECVERFEQAEEKATQYHVIRKPMITLPRRWTKEEEA